MRTWQCEVATVDGYTCLLNAFIETVSRIASVGVPGQCTMTGKALEDDAAREAYSFVKISQLPASC